ncbi:N-sulfoglucosamine sulfohydrolase [Wenyingzhuangia heitensis]|uniref:N-sulfoglucosamine sulfohydrolase n=1 Tax=Wenyingzhuangia heitensis TaxID=1487859 RepID=A0ABX0U7V3_9FLAO|nr:sulfatase [Wenyingzhuangia heitensis]NIJ44828.1 N-sulfoglucosamine sulfohydrolase [Wenyingzhuangia heitensis]
MKKTIKSVLLTSVIFLAACSPKEKKETVKNTKPNIVLFVADDHGKDALGSYGNPIIQTPNLDRMASEGVRFNNAYCTSASCAASRSVILTGKFGHATGSYGHVHDYHHFSTYDNVKSLPVLLEKAGYETARIGKYHVAPEKVYHFNTVLKADPRSTLEMADACVDVIQSEKPFFLYFCTDDPHRGHPFVSEPWNLPNTFGNKTEPYPGENQIVYDPNDVVVPDFLPDTKESREEIAQYYQSISRIDQGFGRLMTHLKEAGKMNNTIVFYISDNGMAFPGAKTTVYEPGIQLPCIIKDPTKKGNKGGVNNAKISWVDLTPTILDMANVPFDTKEFHGKSFNAIIEQENPKGWDEVYASHTFHEITMYYPMKVAIEGKYKLIWNIAWQLDYPFASDLWASSTWQSVYRNHSKMYGNKTVEEYLKHAEFELFDLEKDAGETNNLADKKEYQEVLKHMKAKLKKFQLETRDPWLIMWDHDNTLQGTGVDL